MRVTVSLLFFICLTASSVEWVFAQAPDIAVTPDSANFDVIEIGDMRERSLAVSNSDSIETLIVFALDIRGDDADQFQILDGTGGFVLPPQQLNLVTIRFSPDSPGSKNAFLRIESNDPDENPLDIPLTGAGRGLPDISVSQSLISFGDVVVNSTFSQDLIITNEGFDDLNIEQTQITGDNLDMFSVQGNDGLLTIGTGAQDTLRVSFTPGSNGIKRGVLRLTSNDPDESVQDIMLEGVGVSPQINIDSLSHDYGVNVVGDSSVYTFFVSNTGNANLVIDSLAFRGGSADQFRSTAPVDSVVVRQAEAIELSITYAPTTAGLHTAIVSLVTNDPERPQVDISLRGSAESPTLSVNTNELDFGPLLTNGLVANRAIVLSNLGVANLVIDSLSIDGEGADQFSILNPAPSYTVSPSETLPIVVVYTPTRDGVHQAVLTLFTNDPDIRALVVALDGRSASLQVQTAEEAELGEDFVVNINLPDGFDPSGGSLVYKSADSFDFITAPLSGFGAETQGLVPGLAVNVSGLEFYVQFGGIEDVNAGLVTLPPSEPEQNPIYVPTRVDQFVPPLTSAPWTHQMISVPINLDQKDIDSVLVDDYGPYNTRRWRLFRWEDDDYVEYPEIEGKFDRAKGFWLITDDGSPFDIQNGLSIDPTLPFELVLQPGWNQIGNPYPYPISWLGETIDPRIEPPASFDGIEFQYGQTFLLPWEGYFVRNLAGEAITVPLARRALVGGKQEVTQNQDMLFMLQLVTEIEGQSLRDSQSFIGFARNALEGRDVHDFSEAPPIGPYVRMSIVEEGNRYAGNYKPVSEDGQFWDLEIDASTNGEAAQVRLLSQGQLPDRYELFILDRDKRKVLEIADSTFSIDLKDSGTVRKLRVLIGTSQFIDQNHEDIPLVPFAFKLEPNFPNPFSESTTIRYEISEQSPVRLDVYNLMGQRVQTLVHTTQEAGAYEMLWDGRNEKGAPFASGIYMYRIQAGEFTEVRKMLLVR